MIFVTVGTQLPFERLVAATDRWSGGNAARVEVLAQVGTGRADYRNLQCVRSLDSIRYAEAISRSKLIVAHAGIGSIVTALDRGIPMIVMPRDHLRGEHRDDHQQQTARQLELMGLVTVAWSECDLPQLIDAALARPPEDRPDRPHSTELVDYLRGYLQGVLRKGS